MALADVLGVCVCVGRDEGVCRPGVRGDLLATTEESVVGGAVPEDVMADLVCEHRTPHAPTHPRAEHDSSLAGMVAGAVLGSVAAFSDGQAEICGQLEDVEQYLPPM